MPHHEKKEPFFKPLWDVITGGAQRKKVLYQGDSRLHHITVSEEGGTRTLYLGTGSREAETSISVEDPDDSVFEYPGLMFLGLALTPKNKNILMLGLGGGFIPNLFQKFLPDHNLTVVEVDPVVAELAGTYFGFKPGGNVKLEICDGLEYVARSPDGHWDQIWLDAFNGNYIPEHLATREFLALVKLKLQEEGLAMQNLHQTAWASYNDQLINTTDLFGRMPLLFLGARCANTVAASLNSEDLEPPSDVESVREAVRAYRLAIGPYDLLEEAGKLGKRPSHLLPF
ncbi:MAG: fused MFS/spermidine synthase [Deltaproteobacteria bacterium]|jgi:spermidine synthase|nr:fused MFS/spermidine synthase [Deltaproteobacteria bacterium]